MTRHVEEGSRGAQSKQPLASRHTSVTLRSPRARRRRTGTGTGTATGRGSARVGWALGPLAATAAAAAAALVVAGTYGLQRLGRRWGATDSEVREPLPGDELVTDPIVQTTHAITIAAPPAAVWPWLVQMGFGRAGWYTNDWWYRQIDHYLFHVNMPRVDRILPEQQHLAQGDIIPDGPPGTASFRVVTLEPARALVLYSTTHGTVWLPRALRENRALGVHAELGWVFVLREPTQSTTRLLLRTRVSGGPALYRAFARAFLPPADLFVARMLLRTVKRNVERASAVAAVAAAAAAAAGVGQRRPKTTHRAGAPTAEKAETTVVGGRGLDQRHGELQAARTTST